MTDEADKPQEIQAVFPGPNVGPEASDGTLHPHLGTLTPGTLTFPKRLEADVQRAIDAGLLAPAPKIAAEPDRPAGRRRTSASADEGKE